MSARPDPVAAAAGGGAVGYVLKGYPRLSEIFITSELHRVEQLGVPLRLFVLKAADEAVTHPVVQRVRAVPQYLPQTTSLSSAPVLGWVRRNAGQFLPALGRVLRRRPAGTLQAAGMALAQSFRSRKRPLSWRKIYLKEYLLAVELSDRLLADASTTEPGRPAVRHLHAHFAHGTTTVTWLASRITGIPFSFTGHAKDIYSENLNPAGLLALKLAAARFAVTCTGANAEHLRGVCPTADVHLVYHGLNADVERLSRTLGPARPPELPLLLAVGRLVPKKGLDTFVDACALLRDRGVAFEALVVGEPGEAGPLVRERIAAIAIGDRLRVTGALTQDQLVEQYRRSTVFALPCRVMDDGDRDGIPNVLMEALVCGLPVVTTPISGIPELVEDGVTGLLVPPDDAAALADALARLLADPGLARRLADQGRRTVLTRFDADAMAHRMVDLLGGVRHEPALTHR
jgi:glycosyltransferase involved in cell wall biosynthesis